MAQLEKQKQQTIIIANKQKTDNLTNKPPKAQLSSIPEFGTCIVMESVSLGNGSYCKVAIGGNNSTLQSNAICKNADLSLGAETFYFRRQDGTIELVGGGGSGSGAVSTTAVLLIPVHAHINRFSGGISASGQNHGGL